jgi:phosphopantothenoylcysteine decarboxylase/phosphopantothenate--cysteine ligase
MYDAAHALFPSSDIGIMVAAVADYAPIVSEKNKIKKTKSNITIELKPNPDILASLGKIKSENQILIGFALETNNELENAKRKLINKNLDLLVLNSLNDTGAGFGYDTNKVSIISRDGKTKHLELKQKSEIANDIVNKIITLI